MSHLAQSTLTGTSDGTRTTGTAEVPPEDVDLDALTSRAGGHALVMERAERRYRFMCQCGTPLGTIADLQRVPIVMVRWESHLAHGTPGTDADEGGGTDKDVAHVPARELAHVPAPVRDMARFAVPAAVHPGRRVEDLRPL